MFLLSHVRYKDILDIPHLEIPQGQITCIVGRSGSGKTTLVKLLNRMITPDTGTILYRGTPITEIDPIELRRNVVMLPQTPIMFDGTVRENLLIGREFSGRSPIEDARLQGILEVMDLHKSLDDDASTLSGGEKQRIALGRVLVMRPDVAVLDEPSSALDEGTERTVIDRVIAGAREFDVTIIMVTHARAMAEAVADNLIEIVAGRVVDQNGQGS